MMLLLKGSWLGSAIAVRSSYAGNGGPKMTNTGMLCRLYMLAKTHQPEIRDDSGCVRVWWRYNIQFFANYRQGNIWVSANT